MTFFRKIASALLFCLASAPSVMAEPINKIVAVINDNVITSQELSEQVTRQQAQFKQQRVAEPNMKVLKTHVLKQMIDVEVQLQLAQSNGLEISDGQVDKTIKNIAENNKVSLQDMKKTILRSGETWKTYRDGIRKEVLLSTLQQKSVGQISVTSAQVNDYLKANKAQATLQYHVEDLLITLPEAPSSDRLALTMKQASELMARLKTDLAFKSAEVTLPSGVVTIKSADLGLRSLAALPQMFAERVVSMKKGEITGPIRAANGLHMIKVTDIKGDFSPQMVTLFHVKHILLKSETGVSSEQQKQTLNGLAKQLKQGKTFEELAKKYSKDFASAKQGGDLGWLHKGETVPEFERAFEALKSGQLSAPVKSSYGWHLIKLVGRKQVDDSKAFQKQKIKQALYQRKFGQAVEEWLVQLKAGAYVKTYL
tara:strand:- start:98 stop:1372 length:1275 start_codon:yes stop_codon:yes gene_type:complete